MTNNRVFKLNETFFDNIDTEEKAYFLGWLFSDGYNSEKYYIVLDIQYADRKILDTLSSFIFLDQHPKYIIRKFKDGKKAIKICICSRYMCNKLKEHGMTKTKSLTLKFPETIEDNVLPHFIRGYLDGDGSISTYKNRPTVHFLGTEEFLLKLKNILISKININNSNLIKASKLSSVMRLSITSKIGVMRIIDYIYKDANYFLERKRKKAIEAYEKTSYYSKNKKYPPYRESRQIGDM